MPQMAPYNWLILFLYFNMIMFFIISHINFMNMTPPKYKFINVTKMYYFWMW